MEVVRRTRHLRRELLVGHLYARRNRELQIICSHPIQASMISHIIHQRRHIPSKPVMYGTPKPSGTTCIVIRQRRRAKEKRQESRTSPQPYSRKCFEKSADVLSTQWLARFTTGSSKISGTLSPSLSTFLSPEPSARDKYQVSVKRGDEKSIRTHQAYADPRPPHVPQPAHS